MRSMIRSSFFIDSIPVFVFLLIVPPPAASIIPQRTPRVNGVANSDRRTRPSGRVLFCASQKIAM